MQSLRRLLVNTLKADRINLSECGCQSFLGQASPHRMLRVLPELNDIAVFQVGSRETAVAAIARRVDVPEQQVANEDGRDDMSAALVE